VIDICVNKRVVAINLFHPFDNNVYRIHPLLIISHIDLIGMLSVLFVNGDRIV